MQLDPTKRLIAIEERRKRRRNRAAETTRAAARVLDKLAMIASRYDLADAGIPLDRRLATMSPAEHCAWEMRFQPEPASVASVLRLHAGTGAGYANSR